MLRVATASSNPIIIKCKMVRAHVVCKSVLVGSWTISATTSRPLHAGFASSPKIAPTTSTRRFLSDDQPKLEAVGSSFSSTYHAPVMCQECVDALLDCERSEGLIFVDGTLGGGGHSEAILQQLKAGDVLFGCDVDVKAIETSSQRLEKYMGADQTLPLFIPVQSNFCDLKTKLPQVIHPSTQEPVLLESSSSIDGILLDLGVSSYQIDTAERGFAFMKNGPLDMRMNSGSARGAGLTAADICNEWSESEIRNILKQYGDEPRASKVSRAIVEHRPLSTTFDLVEAVSQVTPAFAKRSRRLGRTATLARVFQSLRIVVNQEDKVLQTVLEDCCRTLVRPGGRLVVLSYHSMEDRAVKRVMKQGVVGRVQRTDQRDMYGNYNGPPKPWRPVGKQTRASEGEVEINTRARSAVLRIAERVEAPEHIVHD